MISNRIIKKSVFDQIKTHRQAMEAGGPVIAQLTAPDGKTFYMNFRLPDAPRPSYDNLPDSCYGAMLSFEDVIEVVKNERAYQDIKYGVDREQSLPAFLLILESELAEAKKGWMKNLCGRDAPLNEIVQVAAVAIACLERYGTTGITQSRNDIPVPQK